MAEKYKGKKYNAYILTCSEREQTFTRHFDALSRHTTQHFMPSAKYVAIWRFSGAQLCAFGWVCACVLVRMTKPCTGQWQWQCVDVSMCGCAVLCRRFVLLVHISKFYAYLLMFLAYELCFAYN